MRIAVLIAFVLLGGTAHAADLMINCVLGDPVAHGQLLRKAVGMLDPGDRLVMGGGDYALTEPLVLTGTERRHNHSRGWRRGRHPRLARGQWVGAVARRHVRRRPRRAGA